MLMSTTARIPGDVAPTRAIIALASLLAVACGGPILVNRGDFPSREDPSAPPLPTDYPWGEPRHVDLDKDGRKDLGYYDSNGVLLGGGFDEDKDGRVDTFKRYGPNGAVIEETRDTNHDGKLDERSIDTDGDGKFDKVVPYSPK
jgi:hypothetical protein